MTRLVAGDGFPEVDSRPRRAKATRRSSLGRGPRRDARGVGVNLNLAPVVDLDVNPGNPAIGASTGLLGGPAVVARDAAIEIERIAHAACDRAQALPGLGSATVNTDYGVADVTRPGRDSSSIRIASSSAWPRRRGHGRARRERPDRPERAGVAVEARPSRTCCAASSAGTVVVTDDLGPARSPTPSASRRGRARDRGRQRPAAVRQPADYDPRSVTRIVDLVERLVGDGRITERADRRVRRAHSTCSCQRAGRRRLTPAERGSYYC